MKKKIIIAAAMAVAVAAFAAPKMSHAASGVHISNTSFVSLERIIRRVGTKISTASFAYRVVQNENNPATVGGISNPSMSGKNIVPDSSKNAMLSCSLNLSNMTFSKVGDYVLTVEEKTSSDETNFPLSADKYDLFVQVTNVLDQEGKPTGELLATLDSQMYSHSLESKVPLEKMTFGGDAEYSHISLTNEVSGAAADTDKYFKYKIVFDGLSDGVVISVGGQDASVKYNGENVVTTNSWTVGEGDLYVYLKHGQEVVIGAYNDGDISANELPQGASYSIEKVEADDGYATSIDGNEVQSISKVLTSVDAADYEQKNTTLAVNSKNATVNTGVFLSVWPMMVLALIGVSGALVYRHVSRATNS